MTTKILEKKIEKLEKDIKALKNMYKPKSVIPKMKITESMLKRAKKALFKPDKFITRKDVERWK